jgi:DNA-binding CsgD family transcriptional regulator/PAS domain-containing protein
VITSIYDAALDSRAWPAALDRVADLLDASTAQLGSYDAATHRLEIVMPRIAPDYAKDFIGYWASRNTIWQQSSAVPVGQVMRPEMFFADGGWRQTDFFNEWYRPQKLNSMIGTNLLVEGPISTVLSVAREEYFTSADIELFTVLVPHLQRAVQLQLRLMAAHDEQAASAEILGKLPQGVLVVDELGTMNFANQAAERILADGEGLRIEANAVRATQPQENALLQKTIASCVGLAANGIGSAGRRVRVSRGAARRPLSVLVIPLRPQASWTRLYRPAAILFVSDSERSAAIRSEHVISEFGLTRAEARLAIAILAGHGLQAAADLQNITLATARTHLAHIFAKTGTNRQAELVRLILQSCAWID